MTLHTNVATETDELLDGLNEQLTLQEPLDEELRDKLAYELRAPGPDRLLYVADAYRAGWSSERIGRLPKIEMRA